MLRSIPLLAQRHHSAHVHRPTLPVRAQDGLHRTGVCDEPSERLPTNPVAAQGSTGRRLLCPLAANWSEVLGDKRRPAKVATALLPLLRHYMLRPNVRPQARILGATERAMSGFRIRLHCRRTVRREVWVCGTKRAVIVVTRRLLRLTNCTAALHSSLAIHRMRVVGVSVCRALEDGLKA